MSKKYMVSFSEIAERLEQLEIIVAQGGSQEASDALGELRARLREMGQLREDGEIDWKGYDPPDSL